MVSHVAVQKSPTPTAGENWLFEYSFTGADWTVPKTICFPKPHSRRMSRRALAYASAAKACLGFSFFRACGINQADRKQLTNKSAATPNSARFSYAWTLQFLR